MSSLAYKIQPAHKVPSAGSPRLALVPSYQEPLLQQEASRPSVSVYWLRRLVLLVVLATLVVGAWSLVGMGVSLVSSRTNTVAPTVIGQGGASPVAQPQVWTVRPGDTLWSIARAIKPQGDIRPVLNPLMKQYLGQPLSVGETISIP